jgi:hypothetical protein
MRLLVDERLFKAQSASADVKAPAAREPSAEKLAPEPAGQLAPAAPSGAATEGQAAAPAGAAQLPPPGGTAADAAQLIGPGGTARPEGGDGVVGPDLEGVGLAERINRFLPPSVRVFAVQKVRCGAHPVVEAVLDHLPTPLNLHALNLGAIAGCLAH